MLKRTSEQFLLDSCSLLLIYLLTASLRKGSQAKVTGQSLEEVQVQLCLVLMAHHHHLLLLSLQHHHRPHPLLSVPLQPSLKGQ